MTKCFGTVGEDPSLFTPAWINVLGASKDYVNQRGLALSLSLFFFFSNHRLPSTTGRRKDLHHSPGLSRKASCTPSPALSPVSKPTTSTCSRSTASTTRRPSKKRSPRCTISSRAGKCATSARRACGLTSRDHAGVCEGEWVDEVREYAESLQSAVSGGGAGDESVL